MHTRDYTTYDSSHLRLSLPQINHYLGLDLVIKLLICKPSSHLCTHKLSSSKSVKGLRSFIGIYKFLAMSFPWTPLNLPWPIYNLMICFSGMTTFAKNLPLYKKLWTNTRPLSFHVLLTNFGLQLMAQWPIAFLELLCMSLTKTACSSCSSAAPNYASIKLHDYLFEVKVLSIAAAIKHFSPFITQSRHPACILTDSQPCVQAKNKLCWGEFSAIPCVTSFLTTISRYQHLSGNLQHLSGNANLPSDFASRNAPECNKPQHQIYSWEFSCTWSPPSRYPKQHQAPTIH